MLLLNIEYITVNEVQYVLTSFIDCFSTLSFITVYVVICNRLIASVPTIMNLLFFFSGFWLFFVGFVA